MTVRLGHAVMDEYGKNGKDGSQIGDQTGKEIAVRDWYASGSGWQYLLVCTDSEMADRAASYMEQICADRNFGYSQKAGQRWSGYKAIVANGGKVKGARGDFDCATLCISCYILAGLNHAASGYTGSMCASLMATGKFRSHEDTQHLSSGDYAKRGALYLRRGHVAMALNDGPLAGGAIPIIGSAPPVNEEVQPPPNEEVDGPSVRVIGGNVNVRTGPGTLYPVLFTAHRGDTFPFGEVDDDTGWYGIETAYGPAFISNKASLTEFMEGE